MDVYRLRFDNPPLGYVEPTRTEKGVLEFTLHVETVLVHFEGSSYWPFQTLRTEDVYCKTSIQREIENCRNQMQDS